MDRKRDMQSITRLRNKYAYGEIILDLEINRALKTFGTRDGTEKTREGVILWAGLRKF